MLPSFRSLLSWTHVRLHRRVWDHRWSQSRQNCRGTPRPTKQMWCRLTAIWHQGQSHRELGFQPVALSFGGSDVSVVVDECQPAADLMILISFTIWFVESRDTYRFQKVILFVCLRLIFCFAVRSHRFNNVSWHHGPRWGATQENRWQNPWFFLLDLSVHRINHKTTFDYPFCNLQLP